MLRLARLLTTLLALTLLAANSASAITTVLAGKPASGLFGALEQRAGIDVIANAGRIGEKLSLLYDFASDFSVAARGAVAGAENAANAARLSKQLASQEGVAELLSTGGKVIAGPGTNVAIRNAGRLVSQYGGTASDWVKVTSTAPGHLQTHAYRNLVTGEVVELKSIIP